MHYWYVRRPDELMCDLDLKQGSLRRLVIARARLRGAREVGKLDVNRYWFYSSLKRYHYHFMVRLNTPLDEQRSILWENRLCDDLFRSNMNFARLIELGRSWSLLITPHKRVSYWREPDYTCACTEKHRESTMSLCPVATQLNCVLSPSHFGDPIYGTDEIILGAGCSE